jgi:hypothetical protein
LLAAGHRWQDIKTYTIPQMQSFIRLAGMRKADEHRDFASLMRVAYHAEGRDFKKYLSALDE